MLLLNGCLIHSSAICSDVSKGYIPQIFNGDFDHKLSKLIELSLASGKAPILHFVDLDEYIKYDSENKTYHLIPMINQESISYSTKPYAQKTAGATIEKPSTKSIQATVG